MAVITILLRCYFEHSSNCSVFLCVFSSVQSCCFNGESHPGLYSNRGRSTSFWQIPQPCTAHRPSHWSQHPLRARCLWGQHGDAHVSASECWSNIANLCLWAGFITLSCDYIMGLNTVEWVHILSTFIGSPAHSCSSLMQNTLCKRTLHYTTNLRMRTLTMAWAVGRDGVVWIFWN